MTPSIGKQKNIIGIGLPITEEPSHTTRHADHAPGGSITNPDAVRVSQAPRNTQSEARTTARGSCPAAKARAPTCWCSTRGPASRPVSGVRGILSRPTGPTGNTGAAA